MPVKSIDAPSQMEEQFVETSDGTRIFVRMYTPKKARGAPIVLLDGIGCEGYAWAYLSDYFRDSRPIVYWQYRGHGRSEVPDDLSTLTLRRVVDDLAEVLEKTGITTAVLCGHSMGVQVALESYRHLRTSIEGLILMCGGYEHPIKSFHGAATKGAPPTLPNRMMRRIFPYLTGAFIHYPETATELWRRVIPTKTMYEIAVRTEVNGRRIDRRDFWPYFEHLGTMDMRVFAHLARALAEHSAADVLPTIDVPTLVIGAGLDTFTPVWLSEDMWRQIHDSEYLHIKDGTHATPIEHPQLINLRVEKFLRERIDAKRKASPARRRARKSA